MNLELPKWLTVEGLLLPGGFLWAVVGAFLPQIALIPVPGIGIPGVFTTPDFQIGPGHLIVIGVLPVVLKLISANKTAFVNTTPKESPDA